MPDKETQRATTSRGRKRKGQFCLWEFWQSKWMRWPPKWRMIRAYHSMEEAVRNKKKHQRDVWWRKCTYKIALQGEEPADYECEKWNGNGD